MKIFEYKSQFGWPGDNGIGLELITQIKRGEKTATAGPKSLYGEEELRNLFSNIGKPATVIDKDGNPHCNIIIKGVFETKFGNPDKRVVKGEGYGDDVESFKQAHLAAWKDLTDAGELEINDDTILIAEIFELVK